MTLPEDCIREILEHLSEQVNSLYSCLFTNRLFCKCVVPILWRNPWRFLSNTDSIIETILQCFPQEIKQSLLKELLLEQQPLFNYVSYIQVISPQVIENLTMSISHEPYYYEVIHKELWSLFMNQCLKIKYLEMPYINLLEYPGSKNSLSSLSTLKVDRNYLCDPKEFIIELSRNVHTLKRIEMDAKGSHSDIETLILSQKNLREILFYSYENDHFSFNNGKTIEYLSQSLRILEIIGCICLSAQVITSFINLTELKIDFSCIRYNNIDIKKLKQILLPKLEVLSLMGVHGEELKSYTKLIENTKSSLKILKIRFIRSQPPLSSIEFYLRTIQTCKNIEVLPVWLISKSLTDFENLLISCSKIREIIIETLDDAVLGKSVLYLLAIKSSSIFLNNIHLTGFSNLDLQEFFELWKKTGRKPLTFDFDHNLYFM